jgi:hypothetical protein
MVCACKIPIPNFPLNNDWGPILWRLLHGIADKYGSLMSPLFAKEQEIYWINLINDTQKILPCKECKEHYKLYLSHNNPNIIKTLSPSNQQLWVQNFFFNLHNEVNTSNNKPLFNFSDLHNTYKNENFMFDLKHYEKLLNIIFQYNEVSLFSWRSWNKNFKSLQSIYGLY